MRTNPALPVLATAAVRFVATLTDSSGSQFEATMSYIASVGAAPITQAEMIAFAAEWRTLNAATVKACLPSSASMTGSLVEDISSGTTPTLVTVYSTPDTGTLAVGAYPSFVSVCLQKQTTVKGQRGKGRLYFGPIATANVTPASDVNRVNAAGQILYTALAAAWMSPVVLAGLRTWNPALTSRPVAPANLVTHGIVLSNMVADVPLSTTRRRKLFRGR
jgi:hypothetical protein